MKQERPIPIACDLSKNDKEQYLRALKSGLFSHVKELRAVEGGYSLRFAWRSETVGELGDFLAVDSACCSFLEHRLEIPAGKQCVLLYLTGPEDAQGALEEELTRLLPEGMRVQPESTRALGASNRTGFKWPGVGLAGVSVAALVCCFAPAIGLAAMAAGTVAHFDPAFAIGIAIVMFLLGWMYWRGRAKRRSLCC